MCDGTEDCPGGEDENSDDWFGGLHNSSRADNLPDAFISEQFRLWVASYLNITEGEVGLSSHELVEQGQVICQERKAWIFFMFSIPVLVLGFCLACSAALLLVGFIDLICIVILFLTHSRNLCKGTEQPCGNHSRIKQEKT